MQTSRRTFIRQVVGVAAIGLGASMLPASPLPAAAKAIENGIYTVTLVGLRGAGRKWKTTQTKIKVVRTAVLRIDGVDVGSGDRVIVLGDIATAEVRKR